MRAEIVSVGTEILLGQIVDTNAAVLGELFAEFGIEHVHRQTVGDNLARLTEALQLALSRADIVFTIGGLGPTEDDLTRQGIADALGDTLIPDPILAAELQAIFERLRRAWTERQLRQAERPTCAVAIANPNGTAPGLICRKDGKIVVALPGPKNEFTWMVNGPVRELLLGYQDGVLHSRVVRVAGIGESVAEERLGDLIHGTNPTVAPYAKTAEVHFRVTARAETVTAAEALLQPVVDDVVARLAPYAYGFDDQSLEATVLSMLRDRRKTLGVAESCTGGGLAARLTGVPGSSDVFLGGVVSYANQVKKDLLWVSDAALDAHGAVSEAVARQMAAGARAQLKTDFAVSITGVAGPGGGTDTKPVGLVWIALAGPSGVTAVESRWRGQREDIRARAVQSALLLLHTRLITSADGS